MVSNLVLPMRLMAARACTLRRAILVERTFDLSDQLAQVQSTFAGAVSDVQGVVDIISGAVAAFDSLSDLGIAAIITKATNGELKGIQDVTDGLKAVQRLPDIVNSLQDRLPELQKVYEEVAERGPSFFGQLQALLSDAWVENLPQAQSSSTRARSGMIEIQNLLVTLAPQANQIAESVALLAGTFSSVTSTGRIGRVDAGVASYQNWISGWFAMPCLTTGKIRLEIPGTTFWTSVPYPKVRQTLLSHERGMITDSTLQRLVVLSMQAGLPHRLSQLPRPLCQAHHAKGQHFGQIWTW